MSVLVIFSVSAGGEGLRAIEATVWLLPSMYSLMVAPCGSMGELFWTKSARKLSLVLAPNVKGLRCRCLDLQLF